MSEEITKDNCGLISTSEADNHISLYVRCDAVFSDSQDCYTQWIKLPTDGYAVFREFSHNYDYEGGATDERQMFIQATRPSYKECETALLEYLNKLAEDAY